MDFDIGVVGLGAMGAASAMELAARGASVIGFDSFRPPHSVGSSHGRSRIIREAYYEHPLYVPLVRRAYDLWSRLEGEYGHPLFRQTGGLMVGPGGGALVRGASRSAAAHGIQHELLDAREITERFPALRPAPGWTGLHEKRAGILFPEECISAMHQAAARRGAILRAGQHVTGFRPNGGSVVVETASGSHEVDRLVVAAGPWLPELEHSIGRALPVEVERQLSHWFAPETPNDGRFASDRTPIALWELSTGGDIFATFPEHGGGVKCGMHHAGAAATARSVKRTVDPAETEAARELLQQVMPGAGGALVEARVCLYTNTPDRHFLIDWVCGGRVLLVSACSGHGFKFASAIGEIAAQLLLDGRAWIDLEPFSLSRFG